MFSKASPALLLLTLSLNSISLNADDSLDQVLSELKALRQQVATLESRIAALESGPSSAPAEQASQELQPRERKTWFDTMRVELKKAEVRASGAWTTPSVWEQIQTGMSTDEVIAVLGEPTSRKFSVRRDTDEILSYQGDLEGSGELVEGEIRIYKGKVRRFSSPDFPSQ